MKITVVTTGGTIDKIYFDAASAYKIGEPQISDVLAGFNVAFDYEVISLMRKDSLELNDQDRKLIRDTIAAHDNQRFVITHGTDTMVQTAQVLADIPGKVMVLTGALNPARFLGSDAVFNIGCAVAAAQTLESGVFIAMNGKVWDATAVRKNRAANRFEAAI